MIGVAVGEGIFEQLSGGAAARGAGAAARRPGAGAAAASSASTSWACWRPSTRRCGSTPRGDRRCARRDRPSTGIASRRSTSPRCALPLLLLMALLRGSGAEARRAVGGAPAARRRRARAAGALSLAAGAGGARARGRRACCRTRRTRHSRASAARSCCCCSPARARRCARGCGASSPSCGGCGSKCGGADLLERRPRAGAGNRRGSAGDARRAARRRGATARGARARAGVAVAARGWRSRVAGSSRKAQRRRREGPRPDPLFDRSARKGRCGRRVPRVPASVRFPLVLAKTLRASGSPRPLSKGDARCARRPHRPIRVNFSEWVPGTSSLRWSRRRRW